MRERLIALAALLALSLAPFAGAATVSGALLAALTRASAAGMQVGAAVQALSPRGLHLAYHARLPLPPASTAKLFVTAAALSALGPGFRYQTTVVGGRPVHGVLDGSIALVGGGDPSLSARELDALASSVARKVHLVRGQVVADASRFSGPPPIRWPRSGRRQGWYPRVSALTLHDGNIGVTIAPTVPGRPPRVTVDPAGGDPVENLAVTGAAGTATALGVTRPHGATRIIVTGRIALGHPRVKASVSIPDPVHFTLRLFTRDLKAHGVRVLGTPGLGSGPHVTLARVASAPLARLIRAQNRKSLNLYAEALLRTLGAAQPAGVGSAAAGLAVMDGVLRRMGVAAPDLVDGCGLSALDRVSAADLVQLLVAAAHEPWFPDFIRSLPMAGPSHRLGGTLSSIGLFPGAPPDRIWAKTGNVGTAETLAGYVRSPGGLTAFAVLTNRDAAWTQGFDVGVAVASTLAGE